jgi:serine protease Do
MPRSTRHRAPLARLTGLVAATAVGVAAIAAPAGAATPSDTAVEKVSNLVEPSIVQLRAHYEGFVRDQQGTVVTGRKPVEFDTTCSGFIVNANGYIATSGRCMDLDVATDALIDKAAADVFEKRPELVPGATSVSDAKAIAQREWRVVSSKRGHRERPDRKVTATSDLIAAQVTDGKSLNVSVRRVRGPENGDVALVKVQAQDLPALDLAENEDIEVGTQAVSVGSRRAANDDAVGLGSSFEQGSITAEKTVDDGLNRAFEVNTAITPAMSGGPTVDLEGRVLGVNRSRSAGSTAAFSLISPATEIQQLLQDVGAPNNLGTASRAYRSGLDAFFRGDRGTALASFKKTLQLQPEFKLAELFQSRAQKLPVPRPREADGGVAEWVKLLIGSGVFTSLLGLVGGGTHRRRRRRRASAPRAAARRASRAADDAPGLVLDGGERVAVVDDVVIGRQGADLVLDDKRVSRRHAVVRAVGGGLEIEDLGSANGTSVNGAALAGRKRLRDGDVLHIGGVRLTVDVGASHRDVTVLATDPDGPYVVVTHGPLAGRSYPVGTELIIGRQDADLLLDDPQVSRHHAAVRAIDGELEVEDLASANGTFVNGSRLDGPRRLRAGDEIAVGPVVLEARIGDTADAGSDTVVAA